MMKKAIACLSFLLVSLQTLALSPSSQTSAIDQMMPQVLKVKDGNLQKVTQVNRIDFSNVPLDPATGLSDILEFEIPAAAISFSVEIKGRSKDNFYFVYQLLDPQGLEIITPSAVHLDPAKLQRVLRPQVLSLNSMLPEVFANYSSTLVPNTDDVKMKAGKWKLKVAKENPQANQEKTTVDLSISVKVETKKAQAKRGFLKLNFYFTPNNIFGLGSGSKMTETAQTSALLQNQLKDFLEFYRSIGIECAIGDVRIIDGKYEVALLEDPETGKPNEEFLDLLKFPRRPGEINVFFLPYDMNGYAGIAPLDGGGQIFLEPGSNLSGIIIREDRVETVSSTLSHELGHFLGLYHTNDDHLKSTMSSGTHHYNGNEKWTPEMDNLMDGATLKLTDEQVRVIFNNPAVTIYGR